MGKRAFAFMLSFVLLAVSPVSSTAEAAGDPTIVVLGGTGVVSAPVAEYLAQCTNGTVEREWGPNRYATAAAISERVSASTGGLVYVATGENFPDAVAAGSAAARDGAPILLTGRFGLPSGTKSELARLSPSQILVLGGEGAVSASVVSQLSLFAPTTRLAGPDRYATAAAISAARFPAADTVFVATGENFPDALAGAPAAAAANAPVLLVARDAIPGATSQELARLKPTKTVVLGGAAVVSEGVASQLPGTVVRLAGTDRYSTAVAISQATFSPGVPVVYVATGQNFPDALAGGAAAGRQDGPILLVTRYSVPSATAAEIARLTGIPCGAFAAQPTTVGDGTWRVGLDIPPGTYRTQASPGCYAARLSGFGGTLSEIIVNEFASVSLVVTVEPSDVGFESSGCGTWTNDYQYRSAAPSTSFGDGTWFVGEEIEPGLWRNSNSDEGCYWERRSGFSWELGDIIANNFSFAIQTVSIGPDDVGFFSEDCGTWTKIG